MMAQTWNQIKEIVGAALDMPPADRPAYLEAACRSRPTLRAEVDSLLDAHDSTPDFIGQPAAFLAPVPDFVGRALGPYRITAKIGEGGMGTVYRAERVDDQYRSEVAIKILKPEGNLHRIAARCRNERQILARLNHPGIARLFDGGATAEGLPYFVMEWIDGRPIDQYCRERRLSLAARLELFQQVCAAVDYAHRNLIVHRDLKPANILITPDGRPKLLDFGIAKIVSPTTDDVTQREGAAWTTTRSVPMTPEYASPEQVRGETVTTVADVYALGVVLYEILAGRHPYRGHTDLRQAICAVEPARPSASDKSLRGDLDTIVLTALRKAPERRYASASALSQDIGRHLAGRPISARPDTIPYRAGKFVRRHKAFCAAAALFVLALFGGMAATLHEARVARVERARAEKRFDDVRKVATSFLFDFDLTIEKLPGSRPARTLVVAKAVEFLDSLANDAHGDQSLLRDLAAAYERVATLQGVNGGPNLGDSAAAAESLRKAISMREAVVRAFPDNVADGLALGAVYGTYAGYFLKNDSVRQQDYIRRALDIRERLYAAHPHDVETLRALGRGYWERSNPLCATADYQNCLEWRMRALHLYDEAAFADPSARNRHSVGMMHKYIAAPLRKLRDYGHALEHSREAIAIDEALAAADPYNAGARRDLSFAYKSAAESLFYTGRAEEALDYARKALDIREQLAAANPSDADLQFAVASAAALVGDTHLKLGHRADAARHFRQALALVENMPDQAAEVRRLHSQLDKTR